jgi:hypothetical protein
MVVTAARKAKWDTNMSLNQCPALPNPTLLTKPLNVMCVNKIGECDKHNVLNFKLAVSSETQGFNQTGITSIWYCGVVLVVHRDKLEK